MAPAQERIGLSTSSEGRDANNKCRFWFEQWHMSSLPLSWCNAAPCFFTLQDNRWLREKLHAETSTTVILLV